MSAGTQTDLPRRGTRRAAPLRAGFAAALLHRLSGIALALFLPMHFIALGTALQGADRLESFLGLTHNSFVRTAEWGLVSALALHMILGLRVLAIEWFATQERTALIVSACVAAGLAVGLLFLLGGA
ncbi:succinate dehydrogenase [Methylobacterium sp. E-041]|uniref:succinate dehydrogenase, cytochrome b556 subunit n=1 Tax=unclassified Methylobacterium TaxID=2615210 RepID=UPI001FB99C7E|nr:MULTISPECIES: succinate dehydrogenase [unclassified Methylobacterium]MCJ2037625.1 succinate dehydrogenase [Methylobacterium sp. J-059]MCJ2105375.1 succinate dehydrogenase [Methylobacterium sp. E-041]